jgi:hypothetical protein
MDTQKLLEKIEALKQKKMDYELKSAQWLMKANDVDEKISHLQYLLNKRV